MIRPLSQSERELITKRRPWFGRGRRDADLDLAANEAEILQFSVRRLWDVDECGPPCCPRRILVETTAGDFIHLESWTALPPVNEFGEHCTAHRTRVSKNLLHFESTGSAVVAEQQSVREVLMDFGAPECERVDMANLPVEFWRVIGQSGLGAE